MNAIALSTYNGIEMSFADLNRPKIGLALEIWTERMDDSMDYNRVVTQAYFFDRF